MCNLFLQFTIYCFFYFNNQQLHHLDKNLLIGEYNKDSLLHCLSLPQMQVRRYNAAKEKKIGILTALDKLLFTCFICHIFHMNYITIPIFFKNNYHIILNVIFFYSLLLVKSPSIG